ncbi:MAG: hypothetical protein HEEMFOPI_01195 [Holosporales bacterium]
MKLKLNFPSIKSLFLKIALTASAISNPFQPVAETDSQKAPSTTSIRLRRRSDTDHITGENLVLKSARLSEDVYFWREKKHCYPTVHHEYGNTSHGSFYSIIEDEGRIYVGFRGTDNLANVLMDCWCNWARDEEQHFYHNGVMKIFSALEGDLIKKLTQIANEKKIEFKNFMDHHVFLTGHSLGGAIALLGAHTFLKRFNAKVTTICFATPIVMDAISAKKLNTEMADKIFNFQQDFDPIPGIFNIYHGLVNKTNECFKSIFTKLASYFLTHPGLHPGHIVKIPHTGVGILSITRIHKISNYIRALTVYYNEISTYPEGYFTPQLPSIPPNTLASCYFRQGMHCFVTNIQRRAQEALDLSMLYRIFKNQGWVSA